MQVGTVNAPVLPSVTPKAAPQAVEKSAPDHDNDSDDKGAAVKSATAASVGKTVDTTA